MQQINLLVAQALDEYYMADPLTQKEYVQHVKDMLERYANNEKIDEAIDIGFEHEYVEAGKLFLNHIEKEQQ
jgi:hypothetical protein